MKAVQVGMKDINLLRCRATWWLAPLVLLLAAGCPREQAPQPAVEKEAPGTARPLVLLVADDPQLGQAIAREWRGHTEQELTVRDVSLADLAKASRLPGDAVIFPSGWLGQLAEYELLVPLDNDALEDPDFQYRDIFDHIRLREMRWGGKTMAAPLGSPQLLLCYRADWFEGNNLSIPTDWQSYQQAVDFFAAAPSYIGITPTIEPLADGWAGQLLLARAAGYAMHRDQVSPLFALGTGEPLIEQPPYVRALEELVKAVTTAKTADKRHTPQEVFSAVRGVDRSAYAMAITWAPTGLPAMPMPNRAGKIAFAPLPTSRQSYRFATRTWEDRDAEDTAPIPILSLAGRLAGISASSQDARRASGFILWLAGTNVSEQVSPQSNATTLFRQSQVARSSRWTPLLSAEESRQYAETLAGVLSSPRAMPGVTVPGRAQYLAALDNAVQQAVSGKPAAEALREAAGKWREITTQLGEEAQRRAQARSLGQIGM